MYCGIDDMRGNSCSLLGFARFVRGTLQSNSGMEGMVEYMIHCFKRRGYRVDDTSENG